jgi:dolichyl-phosphate beta-glucosyltransferase
VGDVRKVTWVVPCFNEAQRLDGRLIEVLVSDQSTQVLLVDDGSTDGTLALLEALAQQHPGRVSVLGLTPNAGKAEAVRRGMRQAAASCEAVGYADADFSTPPEELHRLASNLSQRDLAVVIGSRVGLAGTRIERKPTRHYLGRLFGTAASLLLGTIIYDTQCGAKVFRVSPLLQASLVEPFGSRWIFDVELLGRLLIGTAGLPGIQAEQLVEVPLQQWRDVGGSKLGLKSMVQVPWQLLKTRQRLQALRSAARGA